MDLLNLGKVAESEATFGQALALNETRLGVGHTLTLSSVVDFSRVLQFQGRLSDALAFCRLELSRAENVVGKDAPDLCMLLADLASIYQSLGTFDKASELLRRELSIREKQSSPAELVHCLYTLGSNVFKCGEEGEGVALCLRALNTAEQNLGPNHFETICALYHLGECHQIRGAYQDGLRCYRQALSVIHRRKMSHPLTSSIITSCGIVQRMLAAPKVIPSLEAYVCR
jgi:tetratricopeptide (TPR) repeat protein